METITNLYNWWASLQLIADVLHYRLWNFPPHPHPHPLTPSAIFSALLTQLRSYANRQKRRCTTSSAPYSQR